jgi:trk system potassium uptake protein TrkH
VDIARLTNAMLFVSILLMMVGAGPGSTAGGFKVSTLAILVLRAWSSFRGRGRVSIFRRTIPRETVTKAMVTAMLFSAVATGALTLLLAFEQSRHSHANNPGLFLEGSFEVISALGTVGLSTGMTPQLSTPGRIIIIIVMFVGRLGPITAFAALSRAEQHEAIEFSSEEPFIG